MWGNFAKNRVIGQKNFFLISNHLSWFVNTGALLLAFSDLRFLVTSVSRKTDKITEYCRTCNRRQSEGFWLFSSSLYAWNSFHWVSFNNHHSPVCFLVRTVSDLARTLLVYIWKVKLKGIMIGWVRDFARFHSLKSGIGVGTAFHR